MKFDIIETTDSSFATISDTALETVVAYFSVDIHDNKTIEKRATELVYVDILMSGAGKYNRAEFLDALNGLGASITVSTSDGIFTLSIRSRKNVAKKVFSLLEIMLLSPHFATDELKRVKQTVANAIIENKENARALAHQQLRNALYGAEDRRFSFKEDAIIEAVKKVTQKDLKALHERILGQFFTCSVAAELSIADELKKSLRKIRKNYPISEALLGIHQQLPPEQKLITCEMPSKQNIEFSIGTSVPITLHHPDFIPLLFGLLILGGPLFGSRLMSTVREKEGLTYSISADAQTFLNEEQGYIRISTFFSPEKTIDGLTSTFREIKTLHKNGISHTELQQFKVIFETKQILIGDSILRQLGDLHSYHMQRFSLEEIAHHKTKIKMLTAEEVNNAIKLYLDPKMLTVSAVGPIKAVKKDLEAFMKTVS